MSDTTSDVIQIKLSPESIATALRLQTENPAYAGLSLRVYLAGKGCDGFEYGVTFSQPEAGDHHFTFGQAAELDVVVDGPALEFVAGSSIEWVDDERGQGFLVENPQHRKFRGKFYKRQSWLDRLKKGSVEAIN